MRDKNLFKIKYVTVDGVEAGKVAKLFSFKTNLTDTLDTSYTTIIFRVIHHGENIISKDYYLKANLNGVKFRDLSPNVVNKCKVFVAKNGEEYGVYFKNCFRWADTVVQLLYCEQPSFFKFNRYGGYTVSENDLTDILLPDSIDNIKNNIIFENSWENYTTTDASYCEIKNRSVEIHIKAKNGLTDDNTIITTLPEEFRPSNNKTINIVQWNGTSFLNCFATINIDGSVKIRGVTTNKQIMIDFNYFI